MYERFSKPAENVIKSAHHIAREYDQEWVGTEHILLAILKESSGRGAQILENRGVNYVKLKALVDTLVRQSLEETWVLGRLPGTPHFRNVISLAIQAAQKFGDKEVGTEHLLLALLKEKGSVAYNALKKLGVRFQDIEQELSNEPPAAPSS
ncbi:MAG: ATP-dependent Clp protease ATP-binding subunit ClpC1 [Phycisphaerae bacterium]|nr:ATP-dependent Clp protease ATP-binding subunit ClpC1 [Phycisphaerae bacterium]